MNKFLLGVTLASLLLSGCNEPADAPASEASRPEASTPETAGDTAAASAPADTPAPVAPEVTVASAETDDKATDDAIDTLLGDHAKYRIVIDAYQKAVAEGDKEAVAALIDYPFSTTIDGKRTSLKSASGFVSNYDKIVTPAIASVIKAQKYSELMVNSKGVMFGSGETWINGICKKGSADCSEFEVKVVAIQPGGSS
ncbi:hypothetical protein [Pseudoxanthomonas sp. CF125]|uniref:hypothetical protein n=1 Tax=Pseudoxanthomonas sp. CF125 TaxID=1855303 RepID=UPI000881FA4F|nr:hypothetical protein [Pseudoxanthomonas sp. CF125]SDQ61563.1 hypothetical protein SAMN05216569_1823 [Pseudoxanthomonas sp. CF125]